VRSKSVVLQTFRVTAVVLLSIVLLPVAPMHGGQAAAYLPGAEAAPDQPLLGVEPESALAAWTRTLEPAVVIGSQMPLFHGAPLDDLFVYKYQGGTWTQLPFQFDEVDSGGTYVPIEDGLLDANDELAFMAKDMGGKAELYQWPDDADSRNYPRYEVQVTNPLSPAEKGWVYVYRSATMAPATISPYVSWQELPGDKYRLVASNYILGYDLDVNTGHYGIDWMELNGTGVDVMDRGKMSLVARCLTEGEWEREELNENDERLRDNWTPPDIFGPVRIGRGTLEAHSWNYASVFIGDEEFDATYQDPNCDKLAYDVFRFSHDWRNPAESGMAPMTYYDSNVPGGVPVDGYEDPVPASPVTTYYLVSGALGTYVQVGSAPPGGGTVSNYYKDLAWTTDPKDTGDSLSYADRGFQWVNPDAVVRLNFSTYILGPHQGNVGPTYLQYHANPLQVAATAQNYSCAPSGIGFDWSPRPVYSDVETTFTATVGGPPGTTFTYEWTFGGGGGVVAGNPAVHTFTQSGTIPVTLKVTNDCGNTTVSRSVKVWEPGTELYFIHMPVILRRAP
jgi:hypothetical protein